jgi:hypothetical protein
MKSIKVILPTLLVLAAGCANRPTQPKMPTDNIPPAAITDLTVLQITQSRVVLSWTTVGDDSLEGQAESYDAKYATFPISEANWDSAAHWRGTYGAVTHRPGETDSCAVTHLLSNTKYYFALRTSDDVGNWSSISNIASATTLRNGSMQYESSILTSGKVALFAVHNLFLYLLNSSQTGNTLATIDVSDPFHPIPVSWPLPIQCPIGVYAHGDQIFALSRCCSWACGPTELTIANALPAIPTILAFHGFEDVEYSPKISDLAFCGSYSYLVYWDSLIIVDIRNSTNPIVQGSFHFPPGFHATGLRVADSVLVAFGGGNSFGLIGASDPDSIRTICVYDAGSPVGNIKICSSILCVLLNTHELRTIDISNPRAPVNRGSVVLRSYPVSMAVQGNKLYAPGWGQLYEIDLTDPSVPTIVDSSDISVFPESVIANDRYIYVKDGFGDIDILVRNELKTRGGVRQDPLGSGN